MPSPPVTSPHAVDQASRAAALAADAAGVTVKLVDGASGAHQAADLFSEVWAPAAPGIPIPAHLIRAFAHSGNYVSAAWAGADLVGASVAFFALEDGLFALHSHITGVLTRAQGSRVGYALKQHQRAWALERGIRQIGWTFDPLIRGNARFNLVKLGAVATAYHPDFYGAMADGINASDRSDRCTVAWDLESPAVVAATEGRWSDLDRADLPDQGGAVLLAAGPDGSPTVPDRDRGDGTALCYVPADMVAMRDADPSRARAWREALAETMGAAMANGWRAETVTRDGWYVLTRLPDEGGGG
jgi:predicted GNAT superfamily acetyltransferase